MSNRQVIFRFWPQNIPKQYQDPFAGAGNQKIRGQAKNSPVHRGTLLFFIDNSEVIPVICSTPVMMVVCDAVRTNSRDYRVSPNTLGCA